MLRKACGQVSLALIVLFAQAAPASLSAQEANRHEYPLEPDGGNNVVIRMVSTMDRYAPVACGVFYFVAPGTDVVDFLEGRSSSTKMVPTGYTDRDGIAKVRLEPSNDGGTRQYKVIYGHTLGCEIAGGPWTSLDGYIEVAGDGQAQYAPHDQSSKEQPPAFWTFGMLTVYG